MKRSKGFVKEGAIRCPWKRGVAARPEEPQTTPCEGRRNDHVAGHTFLVLCTVGTLIAYLLLEPLAGHVPITHVGAVAVIDIALGWTVVGWLIALAMALRSRP